MDIGDGVARATDLVWGEFTVRETAAIKLEDDEGLSSEVLPSTPAIEAISLPKTMMEIEGPFARVPDSLRQDEPSASRPTDVPSSSTDGRDKGIIEDGYETGSDVDAKEVRMIGKVHLAGSEAGGVHADYCGPYGLRFVG